NRRHRDLRDWPVLYLVTLFIATSVVFGVLFIGRLASGRAMGRRLDELEEARYGEGETAAKRRRLVQSDKLRDVLQTWGERLQEHRPDNAAVRQFLIQAGYMSPNAVALDWGARLMLFAGLGGAGLLVLPILGRGYLFTAIAALWMAAVGWIAPPFIVRRKIILRQREIVRALPDALDMMVVCVEAGLALNQALLRVSEEITHVSPLMGEQLGLVNLEIRAGTPREEALRNLADRTDVMDVRSLVTMLIQTDRFGTSIATALRVHADTLRSKRRQRAEEAAAKTTIKLIFPLVFFVFPAMFVVILGPALIQIVNTLRGI
ncbi:MAG: type II secretion system F family protein, partial [Gemmatimonadales bacterium]